MPANYAHYRFGQLSVPQLSADIRRPILRFRQLYDVGLHGPDLFFYYNPLMHTAVGDLGDTFHAQTGREFFTRACEMLRNNPSEGGTAYLYGLLGHYCLDSQCHPFVHAATEDGKIGHVELEVEFDRFLLDKDGKTPPCTQDLSGHMKLTRGECVTVAAFYPPATPANINQSIHHMAWSVKLLAGKNRKFLQNLLVLTSDTVAQNLMQDPANHKCLHLSPVMLELYDQALARYSSMLAQLADHLANGTPLGEDFDPTFG